MSEPTTLQTTITSNKTLYQEINQFDTMLDALDAAGAMIVAMEAGDETDIRVAIHPITQ